MEYEKPWTGKRLEGEVLGFDTETVSTGDLTKEVPQLCVLSAHDGERTVLVGPWGVMDFLIAHQDKAWVGLNTAFDWWVIQNHCCHHWPTWTKILDEGRFHDVMLLDQLLRLAEGRDGEPFHRRGMKALAEEYLGQEVEKDQELRTSFTPEMFDDEDRYPHDWEGWRYAAKDAVVTWNLWNVLAPRAAQAVDRIPAGVGPLPGMAKKVGLLTEGLQVRSAVVLAGVTRTGFAVNQSMAAEKLREGRQRAAAAVKGLANALPGLIKVDRKGLVKTTAKSGQPSMNQKLLRNKLTEIAKERGLTAPASEKAGFITTASEWWAENAPDHPLVSSWIAFSEETKSLQLLGNLQGKDTVHAQYDVIKKTGRTSSYDPNIQQIPRESWFRSLFCARPGHALVTLDFSAIELRTLAAILECRYGKSKLGETIRSGKCPHSWTASMVRGEDYESFVASLKAEKGLARDWEKDPTRPKPSTPYSHDRQAAKAINFGVPGGLGAAKLSAYARASYGVDMGIERAKELRNSLIYEVYPELEEWLADDLTTRLYWSLGCSRPQATRVLGKVQQWGDPAESPLARVVRGELSRADGQPLSDFFVDDCWVRLEGLITKRTPPHLARLIRDRRSGADLHRLLFNIPAVTLTGRSRAKTFYGEYRNTQFQGLAADGAKMCLWSLFKKGHKIVAFIHDEVVVEVPLGDDGGKSAGQEVEKICIEAFQEIMPGDFPIACEWGVGPEWAKG